MLQVLSGCPVPSVVLSKQNSWRCFDWSFGPEHSWVSSQGITRVGHRCPKTGGKPVFGSGEREAVVSDFREMLRSFGLFPAKDPG